jgi:sec-independent protein translocase protein TatA
MIADIFGEQGLIVLVVVVVVLFGGAQIPKLARSLGTARKESKRGREAGVAAIGAPDQPDVSR